MLIIMGGLPKSGKTAVVREASIGGIHITADNYLPPNLDNQPDEIKSKIQISAWEQCMDKLTESIPLKDEIIILDTCGANPNSFRASVTQAGIHGHKVHYVYVDRDFDKCTEHIDAEIVKSYSQKFGKNLKSIKELVDKLHVIPNNGDVSTAAKLFRKATKTTAKPASKTNVGRTLNL